MEKEEILMKARQENKNQDICEKETVIRANSTAAKIGLLLSCLLAVTEIILTNRISYASWVICFGILCTVFFVKFHALRRRHEFLVAVAYLVFFLCFLGLHISRLLGVAV